MRAKKILLSIIAIILAVFAFSYISKHSYSLEGNKIVSAKIKNNIFNAEVVSSDEKMQKGLGGRSKMCQFCGMLFEFSEAGRYSFWMKDMRFPLDIVWISKNKVVHIEKNVKPDFDGILTPSEDADNVLELNAGTVDKSDLQIGDTVSF